MGREAFFFAEVRRKGMAASVLVLGVLAAVVVTFVVLLLERDRATHERSVQLFLLDDGTGNESLIVQGRMGGETLLFLVDTAYAGAPVLSLSYMNCTRRERRLTSSRLGVRTRFHRTMHALSRPMSNYEMHEAANHFAATGRCRMYTSGCTMRLMGIGETSETQSDMFLCPPIAWCTNVPSIGGWDADVFVTNQLQGSPHILTSDYLLHRGPVLIEPRRGYMTFNAHQRTSSFDMFDPVLVGGAFVVPVLLGGVTVHVVVDTGASTTVSISRAVARRLSVCAPQGTTVHQTGVNGENVCSDVVTTDVTLGSERLPGVPVLVNSKDVEGADGYVGIGILRCFDIHLSSRGIGFRRNGLVAGTLAFARPGGCDEVNVCAAGDGASAGS